MYVPEKIREKFKHLSPKEQESYVTKVLNLICGMKAGDSINTVKLTKSETRDAFIETIKWHMELNRSTYCDGLSFANGYDELRKYDLKFLMKCDR